MTPEPWRHAGARPPGGEDYDSSSTALGKPQIPARLRERSYRNWKDRTAARVLTLEGLRMQKNFSPADGNIQESATIV